MEESYTTKSRLIDLFIALLRDQLTVIINDTINDTNVSRVIVNENFAKCCVINHKAMAFKTI